MYIYICIRIYIYIYIYYTHYSSSIHEVLGKATQNQNQLELYSVHPPPPQTNKNHKQPTNKPPHNTHPEYTNTTQHIINNKNKSAWPTLLRRYSPLFGSQHICSYSKLAQANNRLMMPHVIFALNPKIYSLHRETFESEVFLVHKRIKEVMRKFDIMVDSTPLDSGSRAPVHPPHRRRVESRTGLVRFFGTAK